MCDFAVWTGPITREDVEYLGLECGIRNRDATGVSLTVGNMIKTLKGGVIAEEFFASNKWKDLWDTFGHKATTGMVHCRIATHGSPENNENNHPHITESGSLLVHKGIVRPVQYMDDAISDCDSEQILRSLDFFGIPKGLKNISGWAHIAYVPFYDNSKMYLYSNSSPLEHHQFADDLTIVNTSILELDGFQHELIQSDDLDLDTVYTLSVDSKFTGDLDIWKKNVTLNDTHKELFGRSEVAFRSASGVSR